MLVTTTLLFACSKVDDLKNESVKKQEVSIILDKETFVSSDKATEIADLFFSKLTQGNGSTKSALKAKRVRSSIETLSEKGNALMYIINYPNGGFIIIGSTKNYYPVLAYSDKNSFEITSEMSGVSEWLEETKEAIKTSNVLKDTIKLAMQNLWKNYEVADILTTRKTKAELKSSSYSSGQIACWNRCDELQMQYGGDGWNFLPVSDCQSIFVNAGFSGIYENLCFGASYSGSPTDCSVVGYRNVYETKEVGPLLSTQWSQGAPFNNLCNGYPAGCGAIAVAQVMKYYQYPQSFSWNGYAFNWSNIESASAKAALVRLVGNALNMHYASSGSWSTPSSMESGIRLLGYNVSRADDQYGNNYESVQKQLLTYRRPVIMGGNANNVPLPSPLNFIGQSHYWVCDGAREITTGRMQYFTEWQSGGNGVFSTGWGTVDSPEILGGLVYLYYHINWGWGGSHDGWFAFNDVNSGNGNFKYARQDFIITKP